MRRSAALADLWRAGLRICGISPPAAPAAGAAAAGRPADEAAAVTAFWQELGLPGLVDVHTHFMPHNVLAKVWAFFEDGHAARAALADRLPAARRGAAGAAAGVRRAQVQRAAVPAQARHGRLAQLVGGANSPPGTPDALHSATFFAEAGAADYVADGDRRGRTVVQGARAGRAGTTRGTSCLIRSGGCSPRRRVPVIVHCGSGPTPGPHTGPGPISAVLARHPGLVMIIAHLGAPEYEDFLDLAQRYPGVHLDTTMAFTGFLERLAPFPAQLRPRLAAVADRILLGSDFPNIPYPYMHQLQALAGLGLGPDWLRGVCYGNAVRLLRL